MGLKEDLLRLLEEDAEFRYAVAGKLGLLEILERLDKLWEEIRSLREEQGRMWEELKGIREEQSKLWQEVRSLWQEVRGLREEQGRMWEELKGIREEQSKLWQEVRSLWQEVRGLREDFSSMLAVIGRMEKRVARVERTLEKLTLDIEDEAREVVEYKLREMGIDIKLERLELPGLEVNLYGVSDNVCVLGEVAVRAGPALLDELLRKLKRLYGERKDLLRPNLILLLYVSVPTPELIRKAKEADIWLLKMLREYHRPKTMYKSPEDVAKEQPP